MEIIPYNQGIYGATTYLIYDKKTLEGALIDATCCVSEIEKYIQKNKINLKYILLTHGHFDHVYCLSKFKKLFPNALIFANSADLELLDNIETQCNMAGVDNVNLPCVDGTISEDSKNITLGESEIKFIYTPGHSDGGMCYLINNVLFSGDTLFKASIGRCDLFSGSFKKIEQSIVNKLFKLPDETIVYPGHGENTTIGFEKKFNPYFGKMEN